MTQEDRSSSRVRSARESAGIKEYLSYLESRIVYLKRFEDDNSSIEALYCRELITESKKWGSKHKIFYQHIRGKLTTEEAVNLIGISERSFYRLMSTQKAEFISFLEKTENSLRAKYNFLEE